MKLFLLSTLFITSIFSESINDIKQADGDNNGIIPQLIRNSNRKLLATNSNSGGCSDKLNEREVINGKIYACPGSFIDEGGLNGVGAKSLCSSNYEICPSAQRTKELGLTVEECRSGNFLQSDQEFFGTLQGSHGHWICDADGTDDIWGCSKNNVPFVTDRPCYDSLASVIGGGVLNTFNGWSFTDADNEINTAKLNDNNSGGVLCCIDESFTKDYCLSLLDCCWNGPKCSNPDLLPSQQGYCSTMKYLGNTQFGGPQWGTSNPYGVIYYNTVHKKLFFATSYLPIPDNENVDLSQDNYVYCQDEGIEDPSKCSNWYYNGGVYEYWYLKSGEC